MEIFHQKKPLNIHIENLKQQGSSVGLVPTMGALHKGHLSLVKKALKNNDIVVVSIFVNPTQFDNESDLKKYPRHFNEDIETLRSLNNSVIVFAPSVDEVYENNVKSERFDFDGLENEMEGKFRKGHFDGVGTIVKELFTIVKPDDAYFGEKDYQQLLIIKKLVKKHEIPVNIVGCPISRESNGLAMSSRNERLPGYIRSQASFIYETLQKAKEKFGTKSANKVQEWVQKQFQNNKLFNLEYFEIADSNTLKTVKRKKKNETYRAFVAVYVNDIRLIDNIALN
ncbi:pantoate--beta-alanine ligase [Abyssalbus ytuae]|uniref:Pantothenate synthetase n=1 Tax=Abyssalbus ytuae TaxID=2926907 RepID=A0A9E6ZL26_9FLAO|nr:pantoate--beta-alanine ligase [Abyssalbus ytuae]UOB16205.1 pantoate--beta-alanine ligase [Abyssalbus ytuae]